MEHSGFEPLTPTLPVLCATSCANAPQHKIVSVSYTQLDVYKRQVERAAAGGQKHQLPLAPRQRQALPLIQHVFLLIRQHHYSFCPNMFGMMKSSVVIKKSILMILIVFIFFVERNQRPMAMRLPIVLGLSLIHILRACTGPVKFFISSKLG